MISKIIIPTLWSKKSDTKIQDFYDVFGTNKLMLGRMIGGSKSGYWEKHPEDLIIFNANIITKRSGKIWFGDLNVTLDRESLQSVADTIQEDLYILSEMDARFENERAGFKFWKKKAKTVINFKKK